MRFEEFERMFIDEASRLLSEWSRSYGVPVPELVVVGYERIDPFFAFATYISPGWRGHGVSGPAIVFSREYVRSVYEGAVKTGRIDLAMNCLLWSLAHEFGHHVVESKRPKVVKVPSSEILRRGEIAASVIAYRLTGKTRIRKNLEFSELTELRPIEFYAISAFEWKKTHGY